MAGADGIYYAPAAVVAAAVRNDTHAAPSLVVAVTGTVGVAAAGNRVWFLSTTGVVRNATWDMGCAAGYAVDAASACMQVSIALAAALASALAAAWAAANACSSRHRTR